MDKPNVLWLSIESARADYTSMDSDRNTTPFFDKLSMNSDGQWFSNCFSHARWTPAATTSILTGTRLSTHKVGFGEKDGSVTKLPTELSTIPEILKGKGYTTALFSGNPYVGNNTGLDRGFDVVHERPEKDDFLSKNGALAGIRHLRDTRTTGAGLSLDPSRHKDCLRERIQYESFREWFDTKDNGQPYFAYLHINNPHHPYRPPLSILKQRLAGEDLAPTEAIRISNDITNDLWQAVADGCEFSPKEQRALEATYEAELTYADYIAEQIFKYAVSSGEDTVVIITGDHGEMFGESGMLGHNLVLHDGILNVPLVTYGLDTGVAQSDDLIQHADVSKAILDMCDVQSEQFNQAIDFTHEHRDYIVAERGPRVSRAGKLTERNPEFDTSSFHWDQLSMIRSSDWKYQRSSGEEDLFKLPDEEKDVIEENRDMANSLRSELDAILSNNDIVVGRQERMEKDAETIEQLQNLGYL